MRNPRQIKRLCELSDEKLFCSIAEGISLVIENAQTYLRAAEALTQGAPGRAVEHLRLTAEEEAAKVLILLDAVRCHRGPAHDTNRSRTLAYFRDHLARGVYASYSGVRPATFKEAVRFVHSACQDRYYDGPVDDEFECRNWIESRREESLYVDYVEEDGKCYWVSPSDLIEVGQHIGYSTVLNLAEALWRLGCGTPDGVRIIADVWRPIPVFESSSAVLDWPGYGQHNMRTIECLRSAGLSKNATDTDFSLVYDVWNYPLYSLDFKKMRTIRQAPHLFTENE
jgi:AbiV family abortive infection protein